MHILVTAIIIIALSAIAVFIYAAAKCLEKTATVFMDHYE